MTAKKKTPPGPLTVDIPKCKPRTIELNAAEAVRLTREEAKVAAALGEYQLALRNAQTVLGEILSPHLKNGEEPVGWELVLDGDKAELVEVNGRGS